MSEHGARTKPQFEYYVVYSMLTDKGSAVGRTQVKCELPMDTMDRVEEVEKAVLENARRNEPSASKLFLMWWHPLLATAGDRTAVPHDQREPESESKR